MANRGIRMHSCLLAIACAAVLLVSAIFVEAARSGTAGSDTLPPCVHPQGNLLVWPPPVEEVQTSSSVISPMAAAESAAVALQRHGVEQPVICEARWIAGAVSGYLVDALGNLAIGDARYSAFRVGIRDGAEARYGPAFRAGAVFTFFAMGLDSAGARIWYPSPGPDITPAEADSVSSGALAYEFLLDREAFQTLPRRYGRSEYRE